MRTVWLTAVGALALAACSETGPDDVGAPPASQPPSGEAPAAEANEAEEDPVRAPGEVHGIDAAYLEHPWAAKGGDCTRPDFDINRNPAGGSIVETRLNGSPRTGYVQRGPEPHFIFDSLRLPIEGRGIDGLAVMPPDSGETVRLAGHDIDGDGVVFVQCPDDASRPD